MATFVRLALEEDFTAIVDLGRKNAVETKALDVFSPDRALQVCYDYLDSANPTIFVAEKQRKVIGFMLAGIHAYDHRDGFYTTQRVLFVSPENRGTRAAVLLIKELLRWSEMLGAAEIIGGNDNSFRSERTAGFLEHFGFEKVGYALAKRLEKA